jgi:hypothetical protein
MSHSVSVGLIENGPPGEGMLLASGDPKVHHSIVVGSQAETVSIQAAAGRYRDGDWEVRSGMERSVPRAVTQCQCTSGKPFSGRGLRSRKRANALTRSYTHSRGCA